MKKALSIKRIIKSFGYAASGFKKSLKEEPNMKLHLIASVLVIICGCIFKVSALEWIILLFAIGMVIGAEILNTSIENLVDLVIKDRHVKAAFVKDTAASFVMILSVIAAIIGFIIFIPKFLALIMVIL